MFARRYTDNASLLSYCLTKSPNSSLHSNLSSFNHFSSKGLRFCSKIGLAISRDSYLFKPPFSSKSPKYCKMGDNWFGMAGNWRNFWIVSTVRSMPYHHMVGCLVRTPIDRYEDAALSYPWGICSYFCSICICTGRE